MISYSTPSRSNTGYIVCVSCSTLYLLAFTFIHAQCHSELYRQPVSELDVFAGIERNKIDVKNPMPSKRVTDNDGKAILLHHYIMQYIAGMHMM